MQARKGGETGQNGEFYQGGQFLPSSPETIKGEFKSTKAQAKPRKQEIALYRWEVSERESIWKKVEMVSKFHKTGYSKETGAQGRLEWIESFNWQASGWTIEEVEKAKELINRWNNGERWV